MNRSLLIVLSVAMLGTAACGQKNETAPSEVTTAFQQKFPDAKKVKWEKESESEWEADFKQNGKKYSANFKVDGTWTETEHAIEMEEIPGSVKHILNTSFRDYKVEESELAERPDGTFYEFEVEKGEEEMELVITADGSSVKKIQKSEHEEEEDD